MLTPRVIFARVGWMERYQGPSQSDPRPKRGGSYNEANVGHEVYNFQPLDGKLYGYFQSPGEDGQLSLSRVDPAAHGESLTDVRVVWVATRDDGGQVVVGWYNHATLLAESREYSPDSGRAGFAYKCVADPADTVLLPPSERVWEVPRGRNGLGQANVLYPIDGNGMSRLETAGYEWMGRVLDQIESFTGLTASEALAETVDAAARGQGFAGDSAWRIALENHAMDAAIRHMSEKGYTPKDEHLGHSYDLRCVRAQETLFVEVKGTTTTGDSVLVSSGEVGFARRTAPATMLFILHSVKRGSDGKPDGGEAVVVQPWNPSDESLSPVSYSYRRGK